MAALLETVLASYGVTKAPRLSRGAVRLACAPSDRARLERDLRKRAEAKVAADAATPEWAERRREWRSRAEDDGLAGEELDGEVARRERVARAEAVEAEVRLRTAQEVDVPCEQLADRDAVRPAFAVSGAERQFLQLHARVLRAGPTDRARSGLRALWRLYWRAPFLIKVLLCTGWAFFVLLVMPGLVWMGYKVVTSKMALAKMVLLFMFTMMLMALGVMLKP